VIGDDSAEIIRGKEGTASYLSGSGGNDTIIGATGGIAPGSTLEGGAGNDSLFSDGVGDIVLGGAGNDTILNESGQASLVGGAGNDVITATDDRTTVYGGAGNDSITFGDEKNIAFGEDGNDTIIGGKGNDIFAGGAGNDYIQGAANSNDASFLFGNEGNDTLILGNKSADSAFGGQGADYVFSGSNATASGQWLFGDKGADTITYLGSAKGILLDGDRNALFQSAGTDAGADVFTVGENATEVTVAGGAGNDSLSGTLGANSFVYMGQGDDFFNVVSKGSSFFSSDLGNDSGTITLAGNDTLFADPATAGSDATLGNDNFVITATGKNFIYLDNAGTTGGNDTLSIFGSGNVVYGGGGNDSLVSSGGVGGGNTLIGGAGNDIYVFGAGDVIPFDSLGNNTYVAGAGASATDRVTVRPGDSFTGGATFVVNGESELIKKLTSGGVIASDDRDFIEITGTTDGLTSLKGGNDTFAGNNLTAAGSVFGDAGDDYLKITGSAEGLVDGGAGNDLLEFTGPSVTSPIVGGDGNDTLKVTGIFAGSASGIEFFEIDTIGAGASINAADTGVELIIPFAGSGDVAPIVIGGAGADTISVGTSSSAGPVFIEGGAGNDILRVGSIGNASLNGGAGDDTLISSKGQGYAGTSGTTAVKQGDFLFGDTGKDVFGFAGTNKLGFIGGPGATGSGVAYADSFVSDGLNGTDGTSYFNNIGVDTISGFVSGEDRLLFNSAEFTTAVFPAITGTGLVLNTNFFLISGSDGLAAVGDTTTFTGNGGSSTAAPSILGGFGTTSATAGFVGDTFGTNLDGSPALAAAGTVDGAFVYDQSAGALYVNTAEGYSNLVAIFDPGTPLAAGDFSINSFNLGGGSILI
jgi:Ca2+-binding RTX toxin-like protein